jgi:hypothetical protein
MWQFPSTAERAGWLLALVAGGVAEAGSAVLFFLKQEFGMMKL